MKTSLLALSFLLVGLSAEAGYYDSYSLPLTGNEGVEEVRLSTPLTKTIYQNQTINDVCYRDKFIGYRQQCYSQPQTICRDVYPHRPPMGYPAPYPGGPRRECYTEYRTVCSSVPDHVREAYTCQKTVSMPVEVDDGVLTADISVRIRNSAGGLHVPGNSCHLKFTLENQRVTYNANCGDFIVVVNNDNSHNSRNGRNSAIMKNLDISLLDAKKVLGPISQGISELRMEGQTLVFRTGDLSANSNYELILKGDKKNLLKKDENLINRNLAPAEYTFERYDESGGVVRINLDRLLGGINTSKKHEFQVTIRLLDNLTKAINVNSKKEVYGSVTIKN